ncbi:unnamed protein product [Brachionus calyciflorus]|uniref:Uncharacterized protein n=1 Tax=Brachionus calyciflorus TaxID=104777 RepID=A0A813R8Z8_9BILA|nr:unnamed protein product [Brachionus calyciflorus]
MHKKSSRYSKTSNNKFETGTLSERSLNNIDESWKVIGNLKSGMRDLEDKLNKYSDNIKLLSSISNTSFNTTAHSTNHFHHEPKNQIFTSTSFNSVIKPSLNKRSPSRYPLTENTILENSYLSSTIQACDPSLVYPKLNTSKHDLHNYSTYDLNSREINHDIRCLNDLSSYNLNGSSSDFKNYNFKERDQTPKTTKVDVFVPSDKPSSKKVGSSPKVSSMINKEKLTRKTSSESAKRSNSEDVKYTEFMQPSSSSFLQQQQQRILHRDNDLLPVSSNQPNITKRHLSSASFNNIIDSNNRFHDFVKPSSRKIAFPKHSDLNENEDIIKNINPIPVSKLNVKEEADRLLGLTSNSVNNKKQKKNEHSFEPSPSQQSMLQFNTNKSTGIITTSSWRVGEAMAQKHVKQQHINEQEKNLIAHPYQLQYNSRSTSAPVNQSPQSAKKIKRTECHLVQTQVPTSSKTSTKTITNNVSSPQLNKNKQKPYDLNDIQKYIQSQKSKRLHETKSEKEKQKIQDEERKKKLQELYRKQRLQAIKSAQINSSSKLNNSNEKHGSHNNSANNSTEKAGSSKLYEQDMSKMLMDRISHLLNDNDKLVEKQRKQYLSEKKISNKKRVDFTNEDIDYVDNDNDQNESSTSSTTSLSANSINLTPKKNAQKSSQNVKHDRLKKICSMALDLQTKLQQTKLKLFGFNPTDEEEDIIDYYKKPDSTFITSTKHEINDEDSDFLNNDDSNLIQVFKQDVRENNTNNNNYIDDDELEFNPDETSRPGIGNIRNFKYNLTPDLAARRIQQAYRIYLAKRKANLARKPSKKQIKKENVKPSSLLKSEQIINLNNPKDGYNFLNIYKKKIGLGDLGQSSNVKSLQVNSVQPHSVKNNKNESNNYTEDFMTYNNDTRIPETEKLSTIKSTTSSGSSSSSDSTSLSKYITNSKSSRHLKTPKSIETQQVHDESHDTTTGTSSSVSSTSTITSSYTKTAQNNSRQKSLRPEPTQAPTQTQKPITRIVQDYLDSKEPKRYSPASLERLLNAGINYLDTLNTSALQFEELDKIRCIGFAQQDTVALAHYLKEKQGNKPDLANKNEKSAKSRSSSLTSNSSSSSSASTTVSSSSYNETESDFKNGKSSVTTSKRLSEQTKPKHRSFTNTKELEQDISLINTVSELNDTKTDTRIRTEIDDEELEMEKSFRQVLPSEMHIKKSRQDNKEMKDQSLYDLSQSSFCSQYDTHPSVRLSFEDDSFKKFTGEIVKKYMQEEELRSKHQADLLKIREKALIEKTKSELAWLEQMKKKAQDKGEDEKMPLILRKEKGIIQKLKQEQDNINKMKEVQRKATENRLKLLSQHSEVVKWCQNKLKQQSLNLSQSLNIPKTQNENENDEISTASTLASTASSTTSSTSTTTSTPTTTGVSTSINNQEQDQLDESSLNLNNQSLIESKIMKQFQHLSSEKFVFILFIIKLKKLKKKKNLKFYLKKKLN